MAPSPEPEDVLPPVNRNAAAPYIDDERGSGKLPNDRFRDRPGKVQMQGVTPQQYANALALPENPVRDARLGGPTPAPPAGALMTDAAARVVAQRIVEMEDRIRTMEDAASRQGTLEARPSCCACPLAVTVWLSLWVLLAHHCSAWQVLSTARHIAAGPLPRC